MRHCLFATLLATAIPAHGHAQDLVQSLQKLDVRIFAADAPEAKRWQTSLRQRVAEVNRRDIDNWNHITTREQWEKYRDERIAALKKSLGQFPDPPKQTKVMTTKTIPGDGFRIENVIYESRPGFMVTANLYVPAKATRPMPGIVIVHSHHNPKTQGELQDMGMTWARLGCLVLVPDLLGHGERRQHPFVTDKSYPGPFKVGRQDYFFRYDLGMQLHLIGDSLMGWNVWDLMRGIDVLVQRPGVAKDKIIVLGSVAGGGDPAAVLAALDPRVAAVAPFNFGGPQPETRYPLPDDAATTFNYLGGGSWESTRNLRLSGRDGFLPWLIVGSVAPRRLIYGHEFSWDREHDPVWKRLEKIYGFYGAEDHLAFAHGRGRLQGQPPEATHCNNIGPVHRKHIYAALKKWFDIPVPEKDYQNRVPSAELQCLPGEKSVGQPAAAVAATEVERRLTAARARRAKVPGKDRDALRDEWAALLNVTTAPAADVRAVKDGELANGCRWKTLVVAEAGRPEMAVPVLLLVPARAKAGAPVVVAVAHEGKAGFLKQRAPALAGLLKSGVAVCLPDLRGCGEGRSDGRGRGSASASATELMLGRTVMGTQLSELLLVLRALDGKGFGPVGLWGDSFAAPNPPDTKVRVPHDADRRPRQAEPAGALLALLGGLFADAGRVPAVYSRGGLESFASLLREPLVYVPHDAVVPGAAAVCEPGDIVRALAPARVRRESSVDGCNRLTAATPALTDAELADWFTAGLAKGSR
jgi:dienelactone hydrolase